jgi:hypothetical protein
LFVVLEYAPCDCSAWFTGLLDMACDIVASGFMKSFIHAPNNSPEPTPIMLSVPHSRLTVTAARLSFCLGGRNFMVMRVLKAR